MTPTISLSSSSPHSPQPKALKVPQPSSLHPSQCAEGARRGRASRARVGAERARGEPEPIVERVRSRDGDEEEQQRRAQRRNRSAH